MYKVFISYAKEDSKLANEIETVLGRIYIQGYRQERTIGFGERLTERIQRAIRGSSVLVALLTRDGIKSQWVHQEIGYALGVGVPVLPFKEEHVELDGLISDYKYRILKPYEPKVALIDLLRFLKVELGIKIAREECPSCGENVEFFIGGKSLTKLSEKRLVFTNKCGVCGAKLKMEPDLLEVSIRE